MKILAIETSCDETAAAVVQNGIKVLSSIVSTQIPFHKPYSGVVPELASRAHVLTVNRVIQAALKKAGLSFHGKPQKKPDALAVTVGPGLVGSLLVGRMVGEALGWAHQLPVYGVNHIEGHVLSPLLVNSAMKPPFLALVASGGHTELILCRKWGSYELMGRTRDDAAGEAFDKVAKMMGLGYPGGPVIDQYAAKGDPKKFPFPRPWLPGTWDFSFSGLKTAVLYTLQRRKSLTIKDKQDISAGFRQAVVDVLVGKLISAALACRIKHVIVGGGVAANALLRQELVKQSKNHGLNLYLAPPHLCTDNAAMIGAAAYFQMRRKGWRSHLKVQSHVPMPSMKGRVPSFRVSALP